MRPAGSNTNLNSRSRSGSSASLTQKEPLHFRARYLGQTSVSQPSGESITADAVKMVRRTSRPRKVVLSLFNDTLEVQDRHSKQTLLRALIAEISYTAVDRKRPRILSFIVVDKQGGFLCHTLYFKSKRRCNSANQSLATMFVASAEAAKRAGQSPCVILK